jgi:hypothetical protein
MNMRNFKGGTLAFVVASTFITVILGIGVFYLVEIIGGGRQLQHANDAGNLNLAKNALFTPFIILNTESDNESQFFSPDIALTGRGDRVNLNNVNRLFGHSLLVEANARAMMEEHSAASNSSTTIDTLENAKKVKSETDSLSLNLAKKLNDKNNLQNFFLTLTNNNSIRMLLSAKQKGDEISQPIHDVSYTNRQFASNIDIRDGQIPDSIRSHYTGNLKDNWTIAVNLGNNNTRHFLKGYLSDIKFSSELGDIHFVPLKNRTADENPNENVTRFLNGQPHLIARKTFEEQKNPSSGGNTFSWANPIPNSFLSQGNTKDFHSNSILGLTSCALSQSLLPTRGYTTAIHRGFIRIKNTPGISADNKFSIGHSGKNDILAYLMTFKPRWTITGNGKVFFEIGGSNNIQTLHNWDAGGQNGPFPQSAANNLYPPQGNSGRPAGAPSDGWKHCAAQEINSQNAKVAFAQYPFLEEQVDRVLGPFDRSTNKEQISVKDAHALEVANLELLSQRSNGADEVTLHTWRSGVAANATSRGELPFPKFKHIPEPRQSSIETLIPNIGSAADIRKRIAQRLKEIDPDFSDNDLPTLLASCDLSLKSDGTNEAYIFFDDASGHLVARNRNNLPTWLVKLAFDSQGNEIKADGIPATWYLRKSQNLMRNAINVPGDWDFPSPYDEYPDHAFIYELYTFTPCTGFHGLLGEVLLEAAFCSEDKPNTGGDNARPGHGVKAPILCPGPGAPFTQCPSCHYEGPC